MKVSKGRANVLGGLFVFAFDIPSISRIRTRVQIISWRRFSKVIATPLVAQEGMPLLKISAKIADRLLHRSNG
jgi:hypothetical protein